MSRSWHQEQPWHQEQTAKLRLMFPDWDVWWTVKAVVQTSDEPRFTWHARPHGARVSVCDAEWPNHLASKIARYVDNLPAHINTARILLEHTPPELHHLHAAVERELQALLALQRSLITMA